MNDVAAFDIPAQQLFRERIFQVTLHRPAHRARPVLRIVTFLDQELLGRLIELDVHLSPRPGDDELAALFARAERDCFVGASLTVRPSYRWTVR